MPSILATSSWRCSITLLQQGAPSGVWHQQCASWERAAQGQLLAQGGQVVLEDYARRDPPFPWRAFEWFVRKIDPGHVLAYPLAEARALCREAALEISAERAFPIDWLWRGWALRAQPVAAGVRLPLV